MHYLKIQKYKRLDGETGNALLTVHCRMGDRNQPRDEGPSECYLQYFISFIKKKRLQWHNASNYLF
jgi:hypothetical protein